MNDWQVMAVHDDERDCRVIALRLGTMRTFGFHTEAEIYLTESDAIQLQKELTEVRRKL